MPLLQQNTKAPYKTNSFTTSGLVSSADASKYLNKNYSATKLGNQLLRIAEYYFKVGCSEEDKDCLNDVLNLYTGKIENRSTFNAWCAIGTWFLILKLNTCLSTNIKFPGNSETFGNARTTYEKFANWALQNGISENETPASGSIFYRYSTESGSSGHIGVVLKVNSDGSFITIEPNIKTSDSEKGAFGMYFYSADDVAGLFISFIHIEDYPYSGPLYLYTEKGCEPEPTVSTPPPAKTSEWTCVVDLPKDDQYTDSSGTLITQLFVANYKKYKDKEEFLKYFRTTTGDDFSGDKNIAPMKTDSAGTFAVVKSNNVEKKYKIDLATCKATLVPDEKTPPPKTPPVIAKSIPCLVELPSNMYFQTVNKELVTYLFVRNFTKYSDTQKFLDMIKADESKKYLSDGNIFAVKKVGNDFFAWATNRGKQQWYPVNAQKCQIEGLQRPCTTISITSNVKHWVSLVKEFWNQPKSSAAVSKYDIIADICDANRVQGKDRFTGIEINYSLDDDRNKVNGFYKARGAALWFNPYQKVPTASGFGIFQDNNKNKIWVLSENTRQSSGIIQNGLVNATPNAIQDKVFSNYFGIEGQRTTNNEDALRGDASNLLRMLAYYSSGYNSSKGSGSPSQDRYRGDLGLDWNSETNDWDIKIPYNVWAYEEDRGKVTTGGNINAQSVTATTVIYIDLFKVLEFIENTKKKLRNPIVIKIDKRKDPPKLVSPDALAVLGVVGALSSVLPIPVSPVLSGIKNNLKNIETIASSVEKIANGEPVQPAQLLTAIYNTAANLAPDTVKGLTDQMSNALKGVGTDIETFIKDFAKSSGLSETQAKDSVFGPFLTAAKNAYSELSQNKNIQSAAANISKYIGLDVKGINSINQMYSNFSNVKTLADLRELVPGNSLSEVQNSLQNYKNMLTMNTVSLKLKTGSLLEAIAEEMYITDIPVMRDFFIAGGANGATGTMPKAYQFVAAIVTKEYPVLNQSSPDLHASLVASVMGLSASDQRVYRDYIKQSLIGEAQKYNEINKANGTDIPYYIPPSIDVDDRECFKIEIEKETGIKVRSCPDGWDYDKTTDCCFNPNTKVYSFCGTDTAKTKKSDETTKSGSGVVGGSTTAPSCCNPPSKIPACITPYENNSYFFIDPKGKRYIATYDKQENWFALLDDELYLIDVNKCKIVIPKPKPFNECIEEIDGKYFFNPNIKTVSTLSDEPFQSKVNPAMLDIIAYAEQNGDIITYQNAQRQVLAYENVKTGEIKYSDVANNYFKSQNISIPANQLVNNPLVQSVNVKNVPFRKDIQAMINNGLLEQLPWHKDIIVYYDKKGNPVAAEDLRNGAKYYGDGIEAKILIYNKSSYGDYTVNPPKITWQERIDAYNQNDQNWNNQKSGEWAPGQIQDVLKLVPLPTAIANTDTAIKTVDTASEPDEKVFSSNLKSGIPVVGMNIGSKFERWFMREAPFSEIIDCKVYNPQNKVPSNSVSCTDCLPNCIVETQEKVFAFNHKGKGDYREAKKIGGVWFALFDDGKYYQINLATCEFITAIPTKDKYDELKTIIDSQNVKIVELTKIINNSQKEYNVDSKIDSILKEIDNLRLKNSELEKTIRELPVPKDGKDGKDGSNASSKDYSEQFTKLEKIYTMQEQRINELEKLIQINQSKDSSEKTNTLIKELQIQLENEKTRNNELQKVTKEVKSSENNTSTTKVTESTKTPTEKTPTNTTCTDCDKLAMPKAIYKTEKIIYDKNFDDCDEDCED